ncbi:MAG: hypothetical protein PUE14_08180, partial [Clostridia bacterium]|nr:hypothetical protein [Clostridia bacterium]
VIPVSEIVDSSILQSVANLFFGLHLALGWSTLEPLLMWLVLFWLYGRYLNLSQGKAGNRMLSLFLAFWTLFDRAMLMKDGSTKLLWANHTQVFKSLLCLIGLYVMWMALLGFLETFLLSHSHSKPAVFRHPFGTPFFDDSQQLSFLRHNSLSGSSFVGYLFSAL